MPDEAEVAGLLALLLLQDARRDERIDANGDMVLLADQDRSRWDQAAVAEGVALVEWALRRSRCTAGLGPYQVQAAIAAVHDEAPRAADTDWAEIAALYGELERLTPTAVVRLNRAVAVAMAEGAVHGLDLLDGDPEMAAMDDNHLYHSTRAELLFLCRAHGRGRRRLRAGVGACRYGGGAALSPPTPRRRPLRTTHDDLAVRRTCRCATTERRTASATSTRGAFGVTVHPSVGREHGC